MPRAEADLFRGVVGAVGNGGPAIIPPGLNHIDLVATHGAVLGLEKFSRGCIEHKALGIAYSRSVDAWVDTGLFNEGIVSRDAAVVHKTQNLAMQ